MKKQAKLYSWDIASFKEETIVHLLKTNTGAYCGKEYSRYWKSQMELDTLANNLKKRPCPDCQARANVELDYKQEKLDALKRTWELFCRIEREI